MRCPTELPKKDSREEEVSFRHNLTPKAASEDEDEIYVDLGAFRGAALKYVTKPAQLEFVPVVAQVDPEACNGCTKCAMIGSCDAIAMIEKKAVVSPEGCVGCSVCSWICPKKAIDMVRI